MCTPLKPLPISFYDRDPILVAKELLGKLLVRRIYTYVIISRIVETEAYLAHNDPASHSFIGKTKRNSSMFKSAGHAYVYRMRHHTLFNVVTEKEGVPSAVLIRAIEPLEGEEFLEGYDSHHKDKLLTNGPAKLTRALCIQFNLDGLPLTDNNRDLYIAKDTKRNLFQMKTSTRIGISKGKEMPLRFYLEGNVYVSKYKKR